MDRGTVTMSQKELQRLPVIEAVLKKQTTQKEAAGCLELSTRQVRRLQYCLKQEGPSGLRHHSRGRPSHRRLPEALRLRVMRLIRQKYLDFGPTLGSEKLAEREKICVSKETVRQWMRAEGLMNGRRRPRPHREWRERRACSGQMVQMDGSHHDWLEGRGARLVLMGYVDDATGKVYGRFYPSEDVAAAMDSFRRYCRLYGIPQSVYLDKHTIYRAPRPTTLEDQLKGTVHQSQFERALSELGVTVIHANSPQAKGRVERLFKTLQDRLVKEMRLAGLKTLEEANRFLPGFLQRYNGRFSRSARQHGNLHRPVHAGMHLEQILCVKEPRVVANDGTIQLHGRRLQLYPPGLRSLAKKGVVVTISPKGHLGVLHDGQKVRHRVLPVLNPPKVPEPQDPSLPRQLGGPGHKPAADNPWRNFTFSRRLKALQTQPSNRTF